MTDLVSLKEHKTPRTDEVVEVHRREVSEATNMADLTSDYNRLLEAYRATIALSRTLERELADTESARQRAYMSGRDSALKEQGVYAEERGQALRDIVAICRTKSLWTSHKEVAAQVEGIALAALAAPTNPSPSEPSLTQGKTPPAAEASGPVGVGPSRWPTDDGGWPRQIPTSAAGKEGVTRNLVITPDPNEDGPR